MPRIEHSRGLATALLALALGATACGRQSDATMDTTTTAAPGEVLPLPGDAATSTTTMSDANLVSLLTTANAGEVEYSQAAAERAVDPRVREFALMMVREHGSMRDSVERLAQRLGVTALAPARTNEMREDVREDLEELRAKNGKDFDAEFMSEQVDMHQETLELLDDLDDDTNTAELRQTIEGAKAKVRAHLERAKQLKGALN